MKKLNAWRAKTIIDDYNNIRELVLQEMIKNGRVSKNNRVIISDIDISLDEKQMSINYWVATYPFADDQEWWAAEIMPLGSIFDISKEAKKNNDECSKLPDREENQE